MSAHDAARRRASSPLPPAPDPWPDPPEARVEAAQGARGGPPADLPDCSENGAAFDLDGNRAARRFRRLAALLHQAGQVVESLGAGGWGGETRRGRIDFPALAAELAGFLVEAAAAIGPDQLVDILFQKTFVLQCVHVPANGVVLRATTGEPDIGDSRELQRLLDVLFKGAVIEDAPDQRSQSADAPNTTIRSNLSRAFQTLHKRLDLMLFSLALTRLNVDRPLARKPIENPLTCLVALLPEREPEFGGEIERREKEAVADLAQRLEEALTRHHESQEREKRPEERNDDGSADPHPMVLPRAPERALPPANVVGVGLHQGWEGSEGVPAVPSPSEKSSPQARKCSQPAGLEDLIEAMQRENLAVPWDALVAYFSDEHMAPRTVETARVQPRRWSAS